jgi:hypothetical protein
MQHRGRTSQALPPPTDIAHLLGFGAVFCHTGCTTVRIFSSFIVDKLSRFRIEWGRHCATVPFFCFFLFFGQYLIKTMFVGELLTEVEVS